MAQQVFGWPVRIDLCRDKHFVYSSTTARGCGDKGRTQVAELVDLPCRPCLRSALTIFEFCVKSLSRTIADQVSAAVLSCGDAASVVSTAVPLDNGEKFTVDLLLLPNGDVMFPSGQSGRPTDLRSGECDQLLLYVLLHTCMFQFYIHSAR